MLACAGFGFGAPAGSAPPELPQGALHQTFRVVAAVSSSMRPLGAVFAGPMLQKLGGFAVLHAAGAQPMSLDPIISAAQAGDAEAFRRLYERHRADVARLVFRMLAGRRSDVDDVIQEVFVQVHRSLRDFRGQSKFTTWLHRVTVNVVLMHRRAAKSRPTFVDDAVPERADPSFLPDEDADRHERMRAFARILAKLPDKKRDVFVLHELEGLPPSEIAAVVGAPVLTVRTRLFYARREIERLMRDEPSLAHVEGVLREAGDATSDGPEGEGA